MQSPSPWHENAGAEWQHLLCRFSCRGFSFYWAGSTDTVKGPPGNVLRLKRKSVLFTCFGGEVSKTLQGTKSVKNQVEKREPVDDQKRTLSQRSSFWSLAYK
jgi:hypothetical protein